MKKSKQTTNVITGEMAQVKTQELVSAQKTFAQN